MGQKKHRLVETSHITTIVGHTLYYRIVGSGPPLLLIHGYGVSGYIWQPTLPYLAQRHQVLVVDLPGYGRSRFTGPWRLRAIAPLLATWLRQMDNSPVALMGQSMGGAIAIHLAACAPELVTRLILVSAAGLPLQTGLTTLALRSVLSSLQISNGVYPRELIRDVLRPRLRLLWESAQEVVRGDFRVELAAIRQPTLILWGEDDLLLPIELGYALSAALPHATFVTLPACGHRPMLAQPELFSQLVRDFLSSEKKIKQ